MSKVTKICFVCLGNIVRSPLAEHLFKSLAEEIGADGRYQVASAGTGAWHIGEEPDRRMRRVAARHGLKYTGRARHFSPEDFETYDWIIAMDTSNRSNLLTLADTPEKAAKVKLMREFDPLGGSNAVVPDPYYGGMEGFEAVFQIVERSCRGLIAALEAGDLE